MRIGLSDKESRAYVTILRNGATTIRVVSEEADISKSYADIVGKLEERNRSACSAGDLESSRTSWLMHSANKIRVRVTQW